MPFATGELPNRPEQPIWLPDGSKIAFVSDRDQTWGDIYVMNADGSNLVNLPAQLSTTKLHELDFEWSPPSQP